MMIILHYKLNLIYTGGKRQINELLFQNIELQVIFNLNYSIIIYLYSF